MDGRQRGCRLMFFFHQTATLLPSDICVLIFFLPFHTLINLVDVKSTPPNPLWVVKSLITEKHYSFNLSSNFGKIGLFDDMKVTRRRFSSSGCSRNLVIRAMAKKNNDNDSSSSSSSSPEDGDQSIPGDGLRGNNTSDSNTSNDSSGQRDQSVNLDWREFRSNLFRREQAEEEQSEAHSEGGPSLESNPLELKWAHPIPVPETGCVLVATEKLDGVRTFERTVVLLLRSGGRHPQEGPFGIVINRPLNKKIKHMKPTNNELATTFADCSLHFGGPLEASMFLLKNGEKSNLPGFEEVIPGLCFGARNSLDEAAALVKKGIVKPQDFRFFVGYAGWQLDQLREEIESDYWHVAACSSNLISGVTLSESLWEEILQLMSGQHSELSRKPKHDL